MAELDRCYRVHLDLSMCEDLAVLIDNVAKIGDLTFIGEKLIVWLNDNKDKKDLIRTLKKAGIKEFFCESIDYSSIGKSENFDFLSSWFMDGYNSYLNQTVINLYFDDYTCQYSYAGTSIDNQANDGIRFNLPYCEW